MHKNIEYAQTGYIMWKALFVWSQQVVFFYYLHCTFLTANETILIFVTFTLEKSTSGATNGFQPGSHLTSVQCKTFETICTSRITSNKHSLTSVKGKRKELPYLQLFSVEKHVIPYIFAYFSRKQIVRQKRYETPFLSVWLHEALTHCKLHHF